MKVFLHDSAYPCQAYVNHHSSLFPLSVSMTEVMDRSKKITFSPRSEGHNLQQGMAQFTPSLLGGITKMKLYD